MNFVGRFDIPEIANHYLGKPLKRTILAELMAEKYLGNVRQLIKGLERLKAVSKEDIFSRRSSNTKSGKGGFDINAIDPIVNFFQPSGTRISEEP